MTSSSAPGVRLRVITPSLLARDLKETVRFYVDDLGFTLESAWPEEDPIFCILDHGDAHLMFGTESWDGHEAPTLSGQLHIDLDGGVQALFERLAGRHRDPCLVERLSDELVPGQQIRPAEQVGPVVDRSTRER